MKELNIYESRFENNSDLIFTVDSNGSILDSNPTVRVVTGYNVDEIKDKNFCSFLLQCESDEVFRHLISNYTNKTDIRVDLRVANDDCIGCLLKSVPFYKNGLIEGYFIILKDMRELDKIADKYIPAPYNYKSITENVLDVIIIMDEQKKYLYVSPSSKERKYE